MKPHVKWFVCFNLFVILAFVLSACSPAAPAPTQPAAPAPTSAPETVKLTFWNNWEGTNGTVMADLVNKFNQTHPGIQVDNVFQPYADIMTLYRPPSPPEPTRTSPPWTLS